MSRRLLNGPANKATWPAAANAALLLVNGRLSETIALDQNELGLMMIIIGCLVAYLVPNTSGADQDHSKGSVSPVDSKRRSADPQQLQSA